MEQGAHDTNVEHPPCERHKPEGDTVTRDGVSAGHKKCSSPTAWSPNSAGKILLNFDPRYYPIDPSKEETEFRFAAFVAFRKYHPVKLDKIPETGVYIIYKESDDDDGPDEKFAIFKPSDEELHPSKESQGCVAGGGAIREMASYILDRRSKIIQAHVPLTILVTCENAFPITKSGSLQQFVRGSTGKEIEESGKKCLVSLPWNLGDMRLISILDLRLGNLDRHDGNVIITDANRVIPIDQGCTFPDDVYVIASYWVEQIVGLDLNYPEEYVDEVQKLNSHDDLQFLNDNHHICFSFKQQLLYHICTKTLQIGLHQGISPGRLCQFLCPMGEGDIAGEPVGYYLMSVQILEKIKESQDKEGRAVVISDNTRVFELKSGELEIINDNVKEWIGLFLEQFVQTQSKTQFKAQLTARAVYQARLEDFRVKYKDTIDAFKSMYLPQQLGSQPPKMEGKPESKDTAL